MVLLPLESLYGISTVLSPWCYLWLEFVPGFEAEKSGLYLSSLLPPSLQYLSLKLSLLALQRHTVWMPCWRVLCEREHFTVSHYIISHQFCFCGIRSVSQESVLLELHTILCHADVTVKSIVTVTFVEEIDLVGFERTF